MNPATAAGGYARPMPALGFDPAPGDVASVHALARRYADIAAEIARVQARTARIDLARWQGKSASAARARLAALAPALDQAAAAATRLSDTAAAWAARLAGFQAEADSLERKAAAQIADAGALTATRTLMAARATAAGSGQAGVTSTLTADITQSASALAAIRAQAEQLHHHYLAAAAAVMSDFSLAAWWHSTEDIRKYPEGVLAILDTVTADHWISWARDIGLVPGEISAQAAEKLAQAETLNASGAPLAQRFAALNEAANAYERAGASLDAIDAFATPLQRTLQASVSGLGVARFALGGAGILGDVNDILSPQDSGAVGWADRGAALVNGGFLTADLVGADMVMTAIPGLGEAAIAVTGIYLAADYFYHHWTPFHDVANDVARATVATAGAIGHDATAAWHSVSSDIGSWSNLAKGIWP